MEEERRRRRRRRTPSSSSSSSSTSDEERSNREPEREKKVIEEKAKEDKAETEVVAVMSEAEMNALGAKIIKVSFTIPVRSLTRMDFVTFETQITSSQGC